uniref:Putative secreted protein n=1 Tax=Anopheles darlingi TaxID=43151 RepID=A0A2M4D0H9_ANODA
MLSHIFAGWLSFATVNCTRTPLNSTQYKHFRSCNRAILNFLHTQFHGTTTSTDGTCCTPGFKFALPLHLLLFAFPSCLVQLQISCGWLIQWLEVSLAPTITTVVPVRSVGCGGHRRRTASRCTVQQIIHVLHRDHLARAARMI